MEEKDFWSFLQGLQEKGRASQLIGISDAPEFSSEPILEYFQGHSLLPKDYDKIPCTTVIQMGSLLFAKEISAKTKKAILMLLAHQPQEAALTILAKYNLAPDKGLECFAQMALEECAMWNEP